MRLSQARIKKFRKRVYTYYHLHKREFPWRATTDPYRILVSEVMLQQTQTDRVMKKYNAFIAAFPNFNALAHAAVRAVLQVWQGLGYNRRALALKQCAEIVVREYTGALPASVDELTKLPGIGRYTASAICAFAFNQPALVIETNIRSVFIHLFFKNKTTVSDDEILPLVEQTLDTKNPRGWYNAVMDYGAMIKQEYNPNAKSSHYAKPTPFKDSNRRIRGLILKALLTHALSEKELSESINANRVKVKNNVVDLEKEGFIKREKDKYRIA